MKCENCIHYGVCVVNSYCHEPCGYYEEDRPHGEWENCGGIFCARCSVCKEVAYETVGNFCPNCGADMRKRDGDRNEID